MGVSQHLRLYVIEHLNIETWNMSNHLEFGHMMVPVEVSNREDADEE